VEDLKALSYEFEYLFLRKIIDGLKSKNINVAQAKEYAQAFLAIEPFSSFEDASEKIMKFVAQYPIFNELKTCVTKYQNERNDLKKIAQMREYIRQNNIDAALKVVKT
jgi:hypothetical protein